MKSEKKKGRKEQKNITGKNCKKKKKRTKNQSGTKMNEMKNVREKWILTIAS